MTGTAFSLVAGAFFLSGASALVYQVVWQRILAFHSGVGLYSVAMIVGAFMAGLGLGSWAGGAFSTRFGARRALAAFALLELGIAGFGAVSIPVLYDWLYLRAASLYDQPARAALLHFLSVLGPTALMGMSLPFLARASVLTHQDAGARIGLLYGINMLGASFGALVTPWVLMRHFGLPGAVAAAVAGNVLAAALALAALGRATDGSPASFALAPTSSPTEGPPHPAAESEAPQAVAVLRRHSLALWLSLYAASGFVALSLEILWFRIMDVAVKSIAFTFGTVLCLYLLGNAVGSLIGARLTPRLARPLGAFLLCQCLLIVSAALALVVLVGLPPETPGYAWFFEYWASIGVVRLRAFTSASADAARLYLVLPLLLYGLPTVLMGLSFPILQRAVHDDARTVSRKVGFLQAANIAGCLLGSLLVGLGLLSALGTAHTLRLLVVLGMGFALIGVREEGPRSRFGALLLALGLLAVLVPSPRALWQRLHGLRDEASVGFFEEDATGVAALTSWRGSKGGKPLWRVYVNGKSNSVLPFGGVHTALGAVPALMHPLPRDIAIVGLGSGDTAWGAACRRDATREVVVFEIIAPQRRLLQALARAKEAPPELDAFLEDPRVRHVVADGRNAIDRGSTLYDVIEMDALFPGSAGSGNLYSVDFFARCARKLRPGGLMAAWAPTPRVFASFRAAFPHVLEMKDRTILVGSPNPIPFEPEEWQKRALAKDVLAYLGDGRAQEVLRDYLLTARPAGDPEVAEVNRDLLPRDEFNTR